MVHFRVELHAVKVSFFIGDGCHRRRHCPGDHGESLRQNGNAVSMTHPTFDRRFHLSEQIAVTDDCQGGAPVFLHLGGFDHSAQIVAINCMP